MLLTIISVIGIINCIVLGIIHLLNGDKLSKGDEEEKFIGMLETGLGVFIIIGSVLLFAVMSIYNLYN